MYKLDTEIENKIASAVKADQRVLEFYHNPENVLARFANMAEVIDVKDINQSQDFGYVVLNSARKLDEQFLVNGRFFENHEMGVCIIPELFYPDQSMSVDFLKGDTKFFKGSTLIGKTITIIADARDWGQTSAPIVKSFQHSYKVIGTYDIVPNTFDSYEILIPYLDEMAVLKELDGANIGLAENFNKTYSLILDSTKSIPAIISKMNEIGARAETASQLGPIGDIARYIKTIGCLVGGIVLSISLMNMLISVYSDLKKREGEIGLFKAMGYKNIQITNLIFLESILVGSVSFGVSMIIGGIAIFASRMFITNSVSVYLQMIDVSFSLKLILDMLLISYLVPIIGSSIGGIFALKLSPKVALSSEGAFE